MAHSKRGGKGRGASKRAPVPEPGQPDYEPESSVEDPENDDGDDAAAPDPLAEAVDGADAEDAGDDENSNDAEEGGDEDAEAPLPPPPLDLHVDSFAMATIEEILTGLHDCATSGLERLTGEAADCTERLKSLETLQAHARRTSQGSAGKEREIARYQVRLSAVEIEQLTNARADFELRAEQPRTVLAAITRARARAQLLRDTTDAIDVERRLRAFAKDEMPAMLASPVGRAHLRKKGESRVNDINGGGSADSIAEGPAVVRPLNPCDYSTAKDLGLVNPMSRVAGECGGTLDGLHAALVESGIDPRAYSTALAKAAQKANKVLCCCSDVHTSSVCKLSGDDGCIGLSVTCAGPPRRRLQHSFDAVLTFFF
ncbi:hypothetical protein JKP88DRAFT_246215 [Tribonema minus]|uniref:Uncharacterized protein n=1 Tax=Tribonema minus TaxID=303371 RepID=A0A836CDU3_9STRA|nr:hypothetical protein JKP88DRAFT_246215 [Tribonema minus]